jgi:hypothetical protein
MKELRKKYEERKKLAIEALSTGKRKTEPVVVIHEVLK